MCFTSENTKKAVELENRFQAKFEMAENYTPGIYNGFTFPKTPVITNKQTDKIVLYQWGLIPHWAKDKSIRENTLNAKIETIHEKPSFRDVVKNRCLVLVDGFFEWKWLDEKGKKKQKYEITFPGKEAFALGGLFSEWVDKATGEIISTYSVLTMEANELMSEIHNSKKRMPVILTKENERDWLNGKINTIADVKLVAEVINNDSNKKRGNQNYELNFE